MIYHERSFRIFEVVPCHCYKQGPEASAPHSIMNLNCIVTTFLMPCASISIVPLKAFHIDHSEFMKPCNTLLTTPSTSNDCNFLNFICISVIFLT